MEIGVSLSPQIDHYLEGICEKLQISPSKYKLAEERYLAVANWLNADGSKLAIYQPTIFPQGSLRIGTTVRPLRRKEFDLDFVCELNTDWRRFRNPVSLLDLLERRIRDHKLYREMCERKNRCIRIYYADDFYMDILPACPDKEAGGSCLRVPDREAHDWKPSNPKGYAEWFESKARRKKIIIKRDIEPIPDQEDADEKPPLKLAVQLLKRGRDIMFANDPENAPISIVLTTLAANHYGMESSVNMAITNILNGITAEIQSLPPGGRIVVCNPSNTGEDLSERWENNREAWQAFVSFIGVFHQQWQALNQQRGIDAIAGALEKLFGEEPTRTVVKEAALATQAKREAGALSVAKSSGILVVSGSPDSTRVQPNTFHGD
jgi:hypothetical protein